MEECPEVTSSVPSNILPKVVGIFRSNGTPIESALPCPAKAGDVLFLSYLTIHGSDLNLSKEARTTLLIQMRDPTDMPTEKVHESRGQGMMLRGVDPVAPLRGVS